MFNSSTKSNFTRTITHTCIHIFTPHRHKNKKNIMLWSEDSNGDRQRDEEHPSSDTNCWECTRPPVRKRSHNMNLWRGRACVWEIWNKIRTERETHEEYLYYQNATVTTMNNQPLQKVTKSLYIVTHLGQLPFMLFTQMARTWAIKEDSVNTSIIHWYSTALPCPMMKVWCLRRHMLMTQWPMSKVMHTTWADCKMQLMSFLGDHMLK